jgi:hypothetical protein
MAPGLRSSLRQYAYLTAGRGVPVLIAFACCFFAPWSFMATLCARVRSFIIASYAVLLCRICHGLWALLALVWIWVGFGLVGPRFALVALIAVLVIALVPADGCSGRCLICPSLISFLSCFALVDGIRSRWHPFSTATGFGYALARHKLLK